MPRSPTPPAVAAASGAEAALEARLQRLLLPKTRARVLVADAGHLEVVAATPLVLRAQGRLVCSASDPLDEAERWVAAQPIEPGDLLVIFGLGAAHQLAPLQARGAGPMLVVEPDLALVRKVLEAGELPAGPIEITDDPLRARVWLGSRLHPGLRARLLAWPATRRSRARAFAATQRALQEALELATISSATVKQRMRVWVEHFLANLGQIGGRQPALRLNSWLRRRPIFLVSAGPSLAKNVAELSRVGGRGAIVAVNTALGALERAGIRADLVVAIEALNVSEQLDGLSVNAGVPRVLTLTANPALAARATGPVFPFVERIEAYQSIAEQIGLAPTVPSGGSVANCAFSLAQLWGASQIVLVGQDLAYSRDGQVYAAGTVFEGMQVAMGQDGRAHLEGLEAKRRIAATRPEVAEAEGAKTLSWVEGWGGTEPVPTTQAFSYFRSAFEQWAAIDETTELINATEGGARIAGFAERPLAEVVSALPAASAGPWPEGAPVDATTIVTALRRELAGVRAVEATSQRIAAVDGDAGDVETLTKRLGPLAAEMHACPLLHGYAWSSLHDVIVDARATPRRLGEQLAADARRLTVLIENTLAELSQP